MEGRAARNCRLPEPKFGSPGRNLVVRTHDPIGPGITPGSGPATLLFSDMIPSNTTSAGILEATGIDFP